MTIGTPMWEYTTAPVPKSKLGPKERFAYELMANMVIKRENAKPLLVEMVREDYNKGDVVLSVRMRTSMGTWSRTRLVLRVKMLARFTID